MTCWFNLIVLLYFLFFYFLWKEEIKITREVACVVCELTTRVIFFFVSGQKVADEKGVKAKKGGARGKKEDGLAQNGDTKTNEVWKDPKEQFLPPNRQKKKVTIQFIPLFLCVTCVQTPTIISCRAHALKHTQIFVSRPSVSVSSIRSSAPSSMSVRGQSETVRVKGRLLLVCVWR